MAKSENNYPHPDKLHTLLQEQEEMEARLAELESAKNSLENAGLPVSEDLKVALRKLQSSSTDEPIPNWAKNPEWIEHLQNKRDVLQKALSALSEVKGADIERIRDELSKMLKKVEKVLSEPKETLHGFSHADYATRVNKVLMEREVSEEGIEDQISQLRKDLASYEHTFHDGNVGSLANQRAELLARRKKTEKILKAHEGKTDEEKKRISAIQRLIAQIDLNLEDLKNKDLVKGQWAQQRDRLIMADFKDIYNRYIELREVVQHHEILVKSGVDIDEESQKKAKEAKAQLDPASQQIKEKLKQSIFRQLQYSTDKDLKDYLEIIFQQAFLLEFKEWTLEAVREVENESKKKAEAEKMTSAGISEIISSDFDSSIKATTVGELIDRYAEIDPNFIKRTLGEHIKQTERAILFNQDALHRYEADLKTLKQLKDNAKKLFGRKESRQELASFQNKIYTDYNNAHDNADRFTKTTDGEDILAAEIEECNERIRNFSEKNTLRKKLLACLEPERIKRLLGQLQSLKAKLKK